MTTETKQLGRQQWVSALQKERNEARKKALDALGRYKYMMFGYWAGIWVHLNRILTQDGMGVASPFRPLVHSARQVAEINAGTKIAWQQEKELPANPLWTDEWGITHVTDEPRKIDPNKAATQRMNRRLAAAARAIARLKAKGDPMGNQTPVERIMYYDKVTDLWKREDDYRRFQSLLKAAHTMKGWAPETIEEFVREYRRSHYPPHYDYIPTQVEKAQKEAGPEIYWINRILHGKKNPEEWSSDWYRRFDRMEPTGEYGPQSLEFMGKLGGQHLIPSSKTRKFTGFNRKDFPEMKMWGNNAENAMYWIMAHRSNPNNPDESAWTHRMEKMEYPAQYSPSRIGWLGKLGGYHQKAIGPLQKPSRRFFEFGEDITDPEIAAAWFGSHKNNPQPDLVTQSMMNRLADKALELANGDIEGVANWLKSIGGKDLHFERDANGKIVSASIIGPSGIRVGLIQTDPNNCAVQLGFATAGVYWPMVYPGLLKYINIRWKSGEWKYGSSKAGPKENPLDFDPRNKEAFMQSWRDLAGTATDPIIVWPGTEKETEIKSLYKRIELERLIEVQKPHPTGTDTEALAYLMSYCIANPPTERITTLVKHLFRKIFLSAEYERKYGLPGGVNWPEQLTPEEQEVLKGLKKDIYQARMFARGKDPDELKEISRIELKHYWNKNKGYHSESGPRKNPKDFDAKKAIEGLVGTIFDPIVVFAGYEDPSMIPDWLKTKIKMDRIIAELQKPPTATDSEALAYLMTASLALPLDRDWHDIYIYVFEKEMKSQGVKEFPGNFPNIQLIPDNLQRELADLKRWIYDIRVRSRKQTREQRQMESHLERKKIRQAYQGGRYSKGGPH